MSEREIDRIIKTYISLLNSSGIPIEKAFLFGSYARGEANVDSDIDIMLISEMFDSGNAELKATVWGLTRKVDTHIEPYIVGMKRFISDDVSPLLQIVRKEGKEIIAL